MSVIQKVSGYDRILAQRARRADAASLADARSAARQTAARNTIAKSDSLRNTLATSITNSGADQSQLLSQVIRTRMAAEAKAQAESSKWYA